MANIYSQIKEALSKENINIDDGFYDLVDAWQSWYRGNVKDFHNYTQQLADGSISSCERLTMNMAKKVAEDFTKLIWSEKTIIKLDGTKNTQKLWQVLDNTDNNLSINLPNAIEKGFALGTMATVEYLDNGKTKIDYITADKVIPYNYSNGYISGLVTLSQFTDTLLNKKAYFTHLTIHNFENGVYTKINKLYKSAVKGDLGKEIPFESMFPNVINPTVILTNNPHFQVFKPNIANNVEDTTGMGISVFANSIDRFKAIDIKYDSFTNEFELGKKMILLDRTALKSAPKMVNGEIREVNYIDRNNKTFVAINGMNDQPVKEIDFSLRVEEHINAINAELNYLSSNLGLGQQFYSFDNQGLKTATEVISQNSDTYRTKVSHQIALRDFLIGLITAVCELEGIIYKEITIDFDDSIIEDDNARVEQGLKLYLAGAISKLTMLTKYLDYSEEEAKQELENSQKDIKTIIELLDAGVIDREKALMLLYGEELDENERLRMIANNGDMSFTEEDIEEEVE